MITNNISKDKIRVIYKIFSGITNIESPVITGAQHNVFFVTNHDGQFVVKFNWRQLAEKNMAAQRLMLRHGVTVPDLHIGNIAGQWYEAYRVVPGITLHEAIGRGMNHDKINDVYADVLTQFARMDKVPTDSLRDMSCGRFHRVAKYNILSANGPVLAALFAPLVQLLNAGARSDMGVYHCDMTPKNIIVSDAGNFQALVDIDSIAVGHRDFALGALAIKYQRLGDEFSLDALYDMCDEISGRPVSRDRVNAMAKLNNMGKFLLWRTANAKRR